MKLRFLWRAWKARYRDQVAELAAIRATIRPGDTVYDIGGNKGSYVYWLSRWVGRTGRVYTFEPQASLAAHLETICRRLSLSNVTVEAKAVYSEAGTLNLFVPGQSDSPGASLSSKVASSTACRSVAVPVIALDDYPAEVPQRVSVLKVDVEGAEKGVFVGADSLIRKYSPLLVFECENRHLENGTVNDVFEHLAALGYTGQFVCGKKLRPLSEFAPEIHQKQTGPRFWDAKDYFNNFVFRRVSVGGRPEK